MTKADGGESVSNEGLGPCPCCGGAARFQQEQRPADSGGWYVECSNRACGLTTPLIFACKDDPKPLLRERWNRRPSNTKYGWLVENGKSGEALRYRTWRDGMPTWTADHNEATRYCRRIDAERAHQEDEDAWLIVQHAWDDLTPNETELRGEQAEGLRKSPPTRG